MAQIRILRWAGKHEVNQSRKVRGPLAWVSVPTRQGRGYCRLVAKHGAAGLGVWLALLELAASRDREARGTIDGTLDDAASMARLDPSVLRACSETLADIGWIEIVKTSAKPARNRLDPTTGGDEADDAPPMLGYTGRDGTYGTEKTDRKDQTPPTPPADAGGAAGGGGGVESGGDPEQPESLVRLLRRAITWTGRTETLEMAIERVQAAGLTEGSIRATLAEGVDGQPTPLDWASRIVRDRQRQRHGGFAAKSQAIPEAKPPSTVTEMAEAAGLTLEQYLEYHPELRDLVDEQQRESA